jgi:hypothetical protein
MPNVWKWRAVDKDGKPVESAPGMQHFESRGPGKKADMIQAAKTLLYAKRVEAAQAGLPDPGYAVVEDSVEAVADDPVLDVDFGVRQPAGGVPVNLPTDPAVAADRERRLVEEGQ